MVSGVSVFCLVMFSLLAGASAQRPWYAGGSSDPGVLPQYLPKSSEPDQQLDRAKINEGSLEEKDMTNDIASWPEDRKPFWYLNAAAIKKQIEQNQPLKQQQFQL